MTALLATLATGLQAAMLLVRGRREGATLLAGALPDAWTTAARSFWALPFSIPAIICLHLMDWVADGRPADLAPGFVMDLAAVGVSWATFAVLTHRILSRAGLGPAWPRFIAAYNWCNVVQYLLMVAGSIPTLLGVPGIIAETLWLVAFGWALWLEWFAIRVTLDVPGHRAAALVMLDVAIAIAVSQVADSFM